MLHYSGIPVPPFRFKVACWDVPRTGASDAVMTEEEIERQDCEDEEEGYHCDLRSVSLIE